MRTIINKAYVDHFITFIITNDLMFLHFLFSTLKPT